MPNQGPANHECRSASRSAVTQLIQLTDPLHGEERTGRQRVGLLACLADSEGDGKRHGRLDRSSATCARRAWASGTL
jgi:hypothetical protein